MFHPFPDAVYLFIPDKAGDQIHAQRYQKQADGEAENQGQRVIGGQAVSRNLIESAEGVIPVGQGRHIIVFSSQRQQGRKGAGIRNRDIRFGIQRQQGC